MNEAGDHERRPRARLARRGFCLVIAAPSGAGKGTITQALLQRETDLLLSVSVTTRAPRAGERDGVHYYFTDQAGFDSMVQRGELLEWARVFGRGYGTPRAPVEAALAAGRDVLFDIDWQGHCQLRRALPGDVVGLYVLPPSLEELRTRLAARGDDAGSIMQRMAAARDEMAHAGEFDYVVMNDDLDVAIAGARAVLHAERLSIRRTIGLDRLTQPDGTDPA